VHGAKLPKALDVREVREEKTLVKGLDDPHIADHGGFPAIRLEKRSVLADRGRYRIVGRCAAVERDLVFKLLEDFLGFFAGATGHQTLAVAAGAVGELPHHFPASKPSFVDGGHE
jgi:hypothetical protein